MQNQRKKGVCVYVCSASCLGFQTPPAGPAADFSNSIGMCTDSKKCVELLTAALLALSCFECSGESQRRSYCRESHEFIIFSVMFGFPNTFSGPAADFPGSIGIRTRKLHDPSNTTALKKPFLFVFSICFYLFL